MIKLISLYLEGDLDALLARWSVPDDVDLKRRSPRKGHLLLIDDQVEQFDTLRSLIAEHWCSTSHYDGVLFIISQAVYRFLAALPQGDTCELDFAPLELI